ncbi:MAG: hypothetical protein P3X23_000925 [Thermosynechococcus sp. Uc]|nr:hypothetical protein [Thermosynechococcus sp. Uc]HIK26426.1 hypothetical protein [Thermosynechococcus sp. M46_R2017_013]
MRQTTMTDLLISLLVGLLTLGLLTSWLWRPTATPISRAEQANTPDFVADAPPPDDEGTPPRRG